MFLVQALKRKVKYKKTQLKAKKNVGSIIKYNQRSYKTDEKVGNKSASYRAENRSAEILNSDLSIAELNLEKQFTSSTAPRFKKYK
jgi:hypothetical protein